MTRHPQDPVYVAETIRAFLDGSGGDWDWDDFTSCSLGDPRLDSIRARAALVDLPLGREEREALERLAREAERPASK